MSIHNAKVIKTYLGIEDHGLLTAYIHVEWGSSFNQGFGGYNLGCPDGRNYGALFVRGVLDALKLDSWEQLKGQYCRIRKEDDHLNARIVAIGHIVEESWFCYDNVLTGKWVES
jgi:hypothetical protein